MSRVDKLNEVTVDINSMYDALRPLILSAKEIENKIEQNPEVKSILDDVFNELTNSIKVLVDKLKKLFESYNQLVTL